MYFNKFTYIDDTYVYYAHSRRNMYCRATTIIMGYGGRCGSTGGVGGQKKTAFSAPTGRGTYADGAKKFPRGIGGGERVRDQ